MFVKMIFTEEKHYVFKIFIVVMIYLLIFNIIYNYNRIVQSYNRIIKFLVNVIQLTMYNISIMANNKVKGENF